MLHEMAWRKEIPQQRAKTILDRLLKAPVAIQTPDGLIQAAWRVANDLGWSKTYDAQYVALATSRSPSARPCRQLSWAILGSNPRYESLDRLVCVVLELRVAKVGNDLGLVDDRSGDRLGGACVEDAALQ